MKFILVFVLVGTASLLFASSSHMEKGAANSIGKRLNKKNAIGEYGRGARPSKAVSLSEILANPKKYMSKEVTISGPVTDVCPKAGCWLRLKGDKGAQSLRVKVKDGDIVFPLSSVGKRVTTRGMLKAIEFTPEKAAAYFEHLAEEKGEEFDRKTAENILANIAGPIVIYQLNAYGAVIQ
ncbi:DUF4920 domain-containing protein [bacterium]|nr:DUF4920 domain-containing protein [bacterium]